MELTINNIRDWLQIQRKYSSGNGHGNGHGHGDGNGNGNGHGNGHGHGDGNGYGNGYGNGHGNGHGDGHGNGHGNGNGHGDGNGHGYGNGYGNGHGDGHGDGYGYGNGDGYGYGNGDGHGDGHGNGHGNGNGISKLNNLHVVLIDGVQTVVTYIKNNILSGFILNLDLSQTPCYVVKNQYYFAHGKTLKEAQKNLVNKELRNMNIEEIIIKFKERFSDISKKYPAIDFFNWHYFLTGSCEMGRRSFCRNHNINIDNDKFTVKEFTELTINNYGSDVITKLKKSYNF